MSEPVSAIRNLGPRSVESFAKAGLHTAEQVRSLGADATYARLIAASRRPHFIAYYALVLGLQGRPWTDLDPVEKGQLRTRFDRIVASAKPAETSEMERILDTMGVRPRRDA